MSNILTVPVSGAIYFSDGVAGSSTIPNLSAGVALRYDNSAGLNITSFASAASASDRFSIDGASGRLFSVSDSLTGSIFSVNDAAGLPIIEVESNLIDKITMGTYGSNALVVNDTRVGIGTALPTAKLDIVDTTLAGSGVLSGSILNLTQTWATSGSPTAIKLNVVNTNSGAASNLLDLQVGGVSQFKVDKSGNIVGNKITLNTNNVAIAFQGSSNNFFYAEGDYLNYRGSAFVLQGMNASPPAVLRFYTSFSLSPSLLGESDGIIAQRNGVNPQESRIYGTYTSATVFERLTLKYNANDFAFQIGTEKGSSGGATRPLQLQTGGTTRMTVTSAGNIGIGTTTPTNKLEVVSGKVLFGDASDTTGTADNGDLTLRAYQFPQLNLIANIHTGNNFFGLKLQLNNTLLGGILLNIPTGEIKIGGFWGGGYFPTFYSNNVEVMRLTTGGNVGIGTTTPTARLTVSGNISSSNVVYASGGNSDLWNNTYTTVNASSANYILDGGNTKGANILIGTNDNFNLNLETAGTTRMTVTSAGAVGIGTANPLYTLDVNGAIGTTYSGIKLGDPIYSIDVSVANSIAYKSSLNHIFYGASTELMRIGYPGNLGLGTANPIAKLDIADTTLAGSGALSGSILNLAQTWATTGAPTAIKLNVTNTASGTDSNLLDLQVGSSPAFTIKKSGQVVGINGSVSAPTYGFFDSNWGSGFSGWYKSADMIACSVAGGTQTAFSVSHVGLKIATAIPLGWSAGTGLAALDTILLRDGAAGILAQRNGVNPQAFRVYRTYTDASNYERFFISTNVGATSATQIGLSAAGTGQNRDLEFVAGGANRWKFGTDNFLVGGYGGGIKLRYGTIGSPYDYEYYQLNLYSLGTEAVVTAGQYIPLSLGGGAQRQWQFTVTGHLIALTDNAYDIGANAATRPRTGYFGTSVVTPTIVMGGSNQTIGLSLYGIDLAGNGLSRANSILLTNSTANASAVNTARIDSPSAGLIEFRVADDTGFASIGALALSLSGQSLSGTSATSLVDLSTTWNTTGNPNAITLNVTNSASGATSNLLDLRIGGNSKFKIDKDGRVFLPALYTFGYAFYDIATNGGARHSFGNGGGAHYMGGVDYSNCAALGDFIGICNAFIGDAGQRNSPTLALTDVRLYRDAAGVFAQRNGVNPQAFRLYNTYTDSVSAFERLNIKWDTNVLKIGTEKGSTGGTARAMEFQTDGATRMRINDTGSVGIGTTAPGNKLHVLGTANGDGLRVAHSAGVGTRLDIIAGDGSNVAPGQIGFLVNGSGSLILNSAGLILPASLIRVAADAQTIYINGGYSAGTLGNSIVLGSNTINGGPFTATSGTQNIVSIGVAGNESWNPASGNAAYNLLRIVPTVNTSGTYAGIVRGLYINPTLTSVIGAEFRALDLSNTSGFGVYQSGASANNYFAGNVGIGTSTPIARLDIADTTFAGSSALSGSALNITQTWNTSGNPTAITLNVTNSASGSTSNLLNLQVGGNSKFKVNKGGSIFSGAAICTNAGNPGADGLSLEMFWAGYGMGTNSNGDAVFYQNNVARTRVGFGVAIADGWSLGFTNASHVGANATVDTIILRDAANTLAQRNGVNPQAFRLYNTFTDTVSAFERLNIKWDANVIKIGTEKGITGGLGRAMEFQTDGTTRMTVTSAGNVGIGTTTPTYKLSVSDTSGGLPFSSFGTFSSRFYHSAYSLTYDAGGLEAGNNARIHLTTTNSNASPSIDFTNSNSTSRIYLSATTFEAGNLNFSVAGYPALTLRKGDNRQGNAILSSLAGDNTYNNASLLVRNRWDGSPAAVIAKLATSTTADIFQVTNESLSPYFNVNAIGNVGIGTTNPIARLDIADTTFAGSSALSGSALNITQTWNTTGNPTAITLNVTNSASGSTSNLLDLRIGGSTRFSIRKDGAIAGWMNSVFGGGLGNLFSGRIHVGDYNFSVGSNTNTRIAIEVDGSDAANALLLNSGAGVYWSSLDNTANIIALRTGADLALRRDAANTLAQRNGVNPQAFRLYNTFTDTVSAFERLNIKWDANVIKIGTEKGSTGGGARAMEFQTDGTTRWSISSAGHLLAGLDITYDIGASGANRPRNIYTGKAIINQTFTNQIINLNDSKYFWEFSNTLEEATFARLQTSPIMQFAGTTASFPAIKRSGAALQIRLADDSGYAALETAGVTCTGTVSAAGDFAVATSLQGVILVSPNSTRWRITVNDNGSLQTTAL